MTTNHHSFAGKSSSIEHCDFDDDKDTLIIKFTSGATYHYPECHKSMYENLKKAESPGKFFHTNLRKLKSVKV